jgi:Replicative DNA helicase
VEVLMSDFINISKIDQNKKNNLVETNLEIPQNIDAEQALLGALLVNNEIYDKINHILKSEHFYDPVHQKIYEICAEKISRNSLASPVTLKTYFQDDLGIKELGGAAY